MWKYEHENVSKIVFRINIQFKKLAFIINIYILFYIFCFKILINNPILI